MLDAVLRWTPAIFTAINAVFTVVVWVISKTLVSRGDLAEMERRVIVLEEHRTMSPGWSALDDVRNKLGEMDGALQAMDAKLGGLHDQQTHLRASVDMIQQHLLDDRA